MTNTDLVVVLPGIMGSTLTQNGTPVWSPSAGSVLRAVRTFGRQVKALQLPDGIGDYHPGDGVKPGELMPDLHLLPGLWTPVRGYTPLIRRLEKVGFRRPSTDPDGPAGNLILFPYDWRLSNRYNGHLLGTVVEPALERWRAQGGQFADAKVCFVCHSMGGLVARWYIAHGGAAQTRKLVTLGTPYRGAARAVQQLVDGVTTAIGPLSFDFTDFARSLPSLYQLLPSYACVTADEDVVALADIPTVPVLDTARLADSARFFADLETAEALNPGFAAIRHPITGTSQTTASTVKITAGEIELIDLYRGADLAGDGTVPAVSGPKGLALDDNTLRHIADKHGNLQRNAAALDEVEAILLARSIVPKAGNMVDLRVDAPELVPLGQDVTVTVHVPDGGPAVKVALVDETGAVVAVQRPRLAGTALKTTFTSLYPGAYGIETTGLSPTHPVEPVSSDLLVWDTTHDN